MPEISRFFGIVIYMYYADHPPPHFHACMGDAEAKIANETLAVIEGQLSPRAQGLIKEWAAQNLAELRANGSLARQHLPMNRIPPLE